MIPVNQLAMFLAHELKFKAQNKIWTLYSIGITGAVVIKSDTQTQVLDERCVGVEYKPLLRPFSTITQKERDGYFKESRGFQSTFVNHCKHNLWANEYYIKLGFDVFGWIEKGWAEDINHLLTPATAPEK